MHPSSDYSDFRRIGGIAAVICAATYVAGFVLLITLLAPLGYGSSDIDAQSLVAFIAENPHVLIFWNLTIYVLNALCLCVLVIALCDYFRDQSPRCAALSQGFGLIWVTLIFGAGMVGNMAVGHAASLYPESPELAAQTWQVLHTVELGLGGGNEIVGALWIFVISIAGLRARAISVLAHLLGVAVSVAGLMTAVPPIADIAGAVFGMGMIVWFVWIGIGLMSNPDTTVPCQD